MNRPKEDNTTNSESGSDNTPSFVGVGASAGGLEALQRMFERMPTDTGMAFVVVQHLSPDFKSLMDELLARWTRMPIFRVEDGMRVAANAIYLIPPKKEIIIAEGLLLLTDKDPTQTLTLPIDHFFRSLAQEMGSRSIAIILSGTGSDGSRGVRHIHEAGGLVIAQQEESAKFDGMPRSARETGVVKLFLAPEEIPEAIKRYGENPNQDELISALQPNNPESGDLNTLFRLLRDAFGIDFSHYKLNTIVRRTERRLQLNCVADLAQYVERVRDDPRELSNLYKDLLIGVTRFFRDEAAYKRLGEVLGEAVRELPADGELRVWVAGCATGEEAYSIAIVLDEQIRKLGRSIDVKIFATDVHKASLEFANQGMYSADSVSHLSKERLNRYFTKSRDGYQVGPPLRSMIVFAAHNIIKDAPFTRIDLITCRNMLIYLQPQAQKKAVSLFHFGLRTGGVLFLGPSESAGEYADEFDILDHHWKIFRKRRDVRLSADLRMPLYTTMPAPVRSSGLPALYAPGNRMAEGHLLGAFDVMLSTFMPPAVLVNDQQEILYVFPGASRYLRQTDGPFSTNLFDRLAHDLKASVSAAIQRAHQKDEPFTYRGVRWQSENQDETIKITVMPVKNRRASRTDTLILFEPTETKPVAEETDSAVIDASKATHEQITSLETELHYAKENLQAMVEELETSNEELQATNQELVASNEELQSTNEELHSVNEELYTVNAEHQKKIEQLTELTNDMDNLLAATEVHTVFLDGDLRIRRFTPRAVELFNFVPEDIGRRFETFTNRLDMSSIHKDLQHVLETAEIIEKEVKDHNGRALLFRILPYKSNNKANGVVLTLIDITSVKKSQREIKRLQQRQELILNSAAEGIYGIRLDGNATFVNEAAAQMTGWKTKELIGRNMHELLHHTRPDGTSYRFEECPIASTLRDGDIQRVDTEVFWRKDGSSFPVEYISSPKRSQNGSIQGAVVTFRDISDRRKAETEAAENLQRFERAVRGTSAGMWEWRVGSDEWFCSARWSELLGGPAVGRVLPLSTFNERIHPADKDRFWDAIKLHFDHNKPFDCEMRLKSDAGSFIWFNARALAQRDEDGKPILMTGAIVDIQRQKELEATLRQEVERRDYFMAMLSHELRNPISAIVNAASVMNSVDQIETQRKACSVIQRQSNHMARLLDDLLDVTRVIQGKIQLQKEIVDVNLIAADAMEVVQPNVDVRNQELTVVKSNEPLYVNADPARLQQVYVNLLNNASKYSPPGEAISLTIKPQENEAMLIIKDNGVGVSAEDEQKIFEPFYQSTDSLDRSPGGMGLGLTLVRSLVELHDGRIHVDSKGPGSGSIFTVHLPLADTPKPKAQPRRRQSPYKSLRIALVEDNTDARTMMKELLELQGFEVSDAEDGVSGLNLIQSQLPDVAIVDVGLPLLDGYELARRARQHPDCQHVFLIALTGYGQSSDRKQALDAGFDSHLVKPLNPDELAEILSGVVAVRVNQ